MVVFQMEYCSLLQTLLKHAGELERKIRTTPNSVVPEMRVGQILAPMLSTVLLEFPRPGILLDSALGTFEVENVLKERMHVQPEETRFRGTGGRP